MTDNTGDASRAKDDSLRELRGVVERITFANPDNGFTVARLAPERGSAPAALRQFDERLVTIVGTLADLTPGEAIIARGWWLNSPQHGWQFKIADYRTTLPATIQGMQKYLGSGLVKGIGPVNAARIVEAFGEDTFAIIDEMPERLREVDGIGPVRASRIANAWEEQRHIREVMATLQSYGISTSLATRIYKHFGNESGSVLAEEPFRLAREVWGIGFKTADTIAQAVGMAMDAPARLEAGVLHALGQAADEGHTLQSQDALCSAAGELLGVQKDGLDGVIGSLLDAGELAVAEQDTDDSLLALAPFARAESGIAFRLKGLAAGGTGRAALQFAQLDWERAFAWLREQHGLVLTTDQCASVKAALTVPVSILTGGPGTGKTHTLKAIVCLAKARGLACFLAAPTGRAAKRMAEATGEGAATLHRLLGLRPGTRAKHNSEHPLEADIVIVDESSMLDVLLANQLIRALGPGTHLLLVGDPDQLPSVGAGNVLADLLAAKAFPMTRLEHIFRQGAGSGIAANARRVNAGELPRFGDDIRDCFFLPAADATAVAAGVVDMVVRRIPARGRYAARDVQVLAPMHRGDAGVAALNAELQEQLNPAQQGTAETRVAGRAYRTGDRVLQLRNDYDLDIFNGDLGTIEHVDLQEQELRLRLDDDREVRYPFASLYALTHAYALSVHKAQGAEFPVVVLPVVTNHAALLSRTLLYTALTRAREVVILVGQWKALALAVRNWRQAPRQSALAGLLDGRVAYVWSRAGEQAHSNAEVHESVADISLL